ncbi:amine dehydrogenase large subunit [Pseudomaricurvus alkylphenolicus]|uniref:amine dehydrogenase large subunit n=1 Tax=Pseudomaricurvus alkylphenolicus TaxID=1306991 RepID=UPI001F10C411|nr:amine dehydrogenase large subunit [Pseudomaricurvus alkylphenolicus]
MRSKFKQLGLGLALAAFAGVGQLALAAGKPDPLPIEEIGRIESLPASYPEDWVLVDEAAFFSMYGGKVIIMDIGEKEHPKRMKGTMSKAMLGSFTQSPKRGEYYIIESFHERGSRGKKFDVLVIYNKQTLEVQKEIMWPTDRLQSLPEKFSMAVSKDERFLYVANFNPAASFSVVDLETREIVDTIGTPGCVLTYPTGKRSVTSICSNGGLLTTVLDKNGKLKSRKRIKPFFDTDNTPIFERPVIVDGKAYFPSFKGLMHVVDLSGSVAKYRGSWDMLSDEQKAGNWRPGGLGLAGRDDKGHYYVIMHPDGAEGTQTHGGPEVWVYDLKKKKRIRTIAAPRWAVSIGVTRGKTPKLIVTNGEMNLDIFDATSGEFIQTVSDFGNITPLLIHKSY